MERRVTGQCKIYGDIILQSEGANDLTKNISTMINGGKNVVACYNY